MLSTETVTITAVCSAIALLLLVLGISKMCSRSSTPLPTIQPLAHHREHHLEQLQHPSILDDSSQLLVPGTISEPNNSSVCLLPATPPPDSPGSRGHQSPSNPTHRTHSVTSHSTRNNHNQNTLRGVPHGPHSQIQIMMPAPLALNTAASTSTLSIVDKWLSAGTRTLKCSYYKRL